MGEGDLDLPRLLGGGDLPRLLGEGDLDLPRLLGGGDLEALLRLFGGGDLEEMVRTSLGGKGGGGGSGGDLEAARLLGGGELSLSTGGVMERAVYLEKNDGKVSSFYTREQSMKRITNADRWW